MHAHVYNGESWLIEVSLSFHFGYVTTIHLFNRDNDIIKPIVVALNRPLYVRICILSNVFSALVRRVLKC